MNALNSNKVRVRNKNNYLVIVGLSNGIVRQVKPHAFIDLDKDEVEYLAATSSLFTKHHLTIENEQVIDDIGMDKEEVKYLEDEELKKILRGGKVSDFHAFIDSVDSIPMITRIREMVEGMDLPSSRARYITEKLGIEI